MLSYTIVESNWFRYSRVRGARSAVNYESARSQRTLVTFFDFSMKATSGSWLKCFVAHPQSKLPQPIFAKSEPKCVPLSSLIAPPGNHRYGRRNNYSEPIGLLSEHPVINAEC